MVIGVCLDGDPDREEQPVIHRENVNKVAVKKGVFGGFIAGVPFNIILVNSILTQFKAVLYKGFS